MSESPYTESDVLEDVVDETKLKEPARAILFNDEVHTFDEVINQIIKALKCDRAKAESLTWEGLLLVKVTPAVWELPPEKKPLGWQLQTKIRQK